MTKNVTEFPGATRLKTPVPRILAGAAGARLKDVVIIGRDENDEIFLSSSSPDGPDVVWLIELAKKAILEAAE